jgi:hypothetical protein
MAGGIAEIPEFAGIRCEYIPGRDRGWMKRSKWDAYLRDRLVALVNETHATVISFDGVVPYPGVIATKLKSPKLNLVWIRRGLWRKNPLRFGLPLQSKMMDFVIEPGDFAAAYDSGPTSLQKDAVNIAPVSLYNKSFAFNREDAMKAIGLDPSRPAVLVQLGTGENDANEKMRLYASANILEYWRVDVASQTIVVHREPNGSAYQLVMEYGAESTIHPLCEPKAILEVKNVFA